MPTHLSIAKLIPTLLGALLALGLAGCPSSPNADGVGVSCKNASDCDELERAYGTEFSCDPELKLCVSTTPAGDGGTTGCNPGCTGAEVCEAGSCVIPGPTVTLLTPLQGGIVFDTISVMADVAPGPAGLDSVTCQVGDQPAQPAAQRGGTGPWTCELTVGGADGPRRVVVTAADPDGRTGSDEVTVIRDTLDPTITITLSQEGIGPVDANTETWPTGVDGHGPLTIKVEVTEEHFSPDDLVVQIPRRAGLQAFAPTMSCDLAGIVHGCVGTLDLTTSDFALDGTRGEQVVYASATDAAGNVGEDSARFHIDDRPPRLQDSGCSGLAQNSDGDVLRNSTLECLVSVTESETRVDGVPTASMAGIAAGDITVLPAVGSEWAISAKLEGHSFDAFEPTLDIIVTARDLWGNTASTIVQQKASRLRWRRDLGSDLLSPALAPGGYLYVVVNIGPGESQLHSLDPVTGGERQVRTLSLANDETILAGPVIQQRSNGATSLHLLTSRGTILTLGDLSGDVWAPQRPVAWAGFNVNFRSLPIISADGDRAYAVVERAETGNLSFETALEAIGGIYTGADPACTSTPVAGSMNWANSAAWTLPSGAGLGGTATVIFAADQVGNGAIGTCVDCDCILYRDQSPPQRWGGIAAFDGGFLYAAVGAGGPDQVEWGSWDPIGGAVFPTWTGGRLFGPALTAGPVHDTTWVLAGAATAQGDDLLATMLAPPFDTMGTDYGDVAVLDVVLAANGSNWILRKPAASVLEIANVAAGTALHRWSAPIDGVNSFPAQPTIDRPGMLHDPGTESLIIPHGRYLSSIIVDGPVTAGWPMSRANAQRTACIP